MKKSTIAYTLICLILVGAAMINMSGCAMQVSAEDLMVGITPNRLDLRADMESLNPKVADFALSLFHACEKSGKNTLISPLSVLSALSMTANGARGETRSQIEAVLGLDADTLNAYLYTYGQQLFQTESVQLNLANSIWLKDDPSLSVKSDFLQTNADYHGASMYKAPFDKTTLQDINAWVKNKTDGAIPALLEDLPEDAVMCLVNALVFQAQWDDPYTKNQVRTGVFTKEDGVTQNADFLYGSEGVYYQDDQAVGFMKPYKGGKYGFLALLPNEGVSISSYVSGLTGEKLTALLNEPHYTAVHTALPKFEANYSVEMSDILMAMGMSQAFHPFHADFGDLATYNGENLYIKQVQHQSFLSVSEKGTQGGAATAVLMAPRNAAPLETKEIYLNRPFVYMLIDCENNIPFFIGTMMEIGG